MPIKSRLTLLTAQRQIATGEKLSLRQLANLTGIPKNFLSRLNRNEVKLVDLEHIARLCEFFQCEVGDILVYEKPTKEKKDG